MIPVEYSNERISIAIAYNVYIDTVSQLPTHAVTCSDTTMPPVTTRVTKWESHI